MNFKQQLRENPVLVIDTETGGFNPITDALCSVAVMLPNGENPREWVISPYDKIYNVSAMNKNNLSEKYLIDKGITIPQFKLEFLEYIKQNFYHSNFGEIQLLGHNVAFDIGFLKEVFKNDYKTIFHYHFKDSMILANMLKDIKIIPIKQSISLKSLYEYLICIDELSKNAHTALADATMCLMIYNELLNLI